MLGSGTSAIFQIKATLCRNCHLAPSTVSECNTPIIHTNPRSVTIWQILSFCRCLLQTNMYYAITMLCLQKSSCDRDTIHPITKHYIIKILCGLEYGTWFYCTKLQCICRRLIGLFRVFFFFFGFKMLILRLWKNNLEKYLIPVWFQSRTAQFIAVQFGIMICFLLLSVGFLL